MGGPMWWWWRWWWSRFKPDLLVDFPQRIQTNDSWTPLRWVSFQRLGFQLRDHKNTPPIFSLSTVSHLSPSEASWGRKFKGIEGIMGRCSICLDAAQRRSLPRHDQEGAGFTIQCPAQKPWCSTRRHTSHKQHTIWRINPEMLHMKCRVRMSSYDITVASYLDAGGIVRTSLVSSL